MPITNPLELDEILSQVTMAFSANADRNTFTGTNRQFRDVIRANRAMRADAMMRGAMERYRLTKFPPVTSLDQKIRKVVPPIWILATAMSNHSTPLDRREDASRHVGDRYLALEDANAPNHFNPHYVAPARNADERRIQAEGYLFVQYHFSPDRTLREFFESITNKVHSAPIDVTRFFDATGNMTAPELLSATFTSDELDVFGW